VYEVIYAKAPLSDIPPSELMTYKKTPFRPDVDLEPQPSVFLDPPRDDTAPCVFPLAIGLSPVPYGPDGVAHNTIEEAAVSDEGSNASGSVAKRLDYEAAEGSVE
jgi:hypothetical protein